MSHEQKKILNNFKCPSCESDLTKKECDNSFKSYYDKVNREASKIKEMIPVLYVYTHNGKRYFKSPDNYDIYLIEEIANLSVEGFIANNRMPKGDESRRNDKYGITHVNHFFTQRNNVVLSKLNELIEKSLYPQRTKFLLIDINQLISFIQPLLVYRTVMIQAFFRTFTAKKEFFTLS
jgi:hypothetical protein